MKPETTFSIFFLIDLFNPVINAPNFFRPMNLAENGQFQKYYISYVYEFPELFCLNERSIHFLNEHYCSFIWKNPRYSTFHPCLKMSFS